MKQISVSLSAVLLIVVFTTYVYCNAANRYHVEAEFKTDWRGAMQMCLNKGRRLATVNSIDDNNEVLQAISRTGLREEHFWTAGTDQHKEDHWEWETTGQPFTFTYWHPYQPDNLPIVGGENCMGYKELFKIILTGYRWNDKSCDYQAYFICEDYK